MPARTICGALRETSPPRSREHRRTREKSRRMPFFKSMPDKAGPPTVFEKYPEIYGLWSKMSEALMNPAVAHQPGRAGADPRRTPPASPAAPSSGSPTPRSPMPGASKTASSSGFCKTRKTAPVEPRLKPLLAYVRKLMVAPGEMAQADADAVFEGGLGRYALHDAIAVTARAAFMQRLVEGRRPRPDVAPGSGQARSGTRGARLCEPLSG